MARTSASAFEGYPPYLPPGLVGLQTLYLQRNQLDDVGVSALARSLRGTAAPVAVVALVANRFRARGAAELAEAVVHCAALEQLYVGSNSLTADGVRVLKEAVAQRGEAAPVQVVF